MTILFLKGILILWGQNHEKITCEKLRDDRSWFEANLCRAKNLALIFNPIWAVALNSVRYFDFKGPKSWKNYTWNSGVMTNGNLRPNCALDKKVEENRPPLIF